MPDVKSDLKRIDTAITWLLIVGGGLLVVGLFTRLSAVVLALFLLTVMATQPPWIAGTVETYYQGVECVALLVLATSPAGRWAGLDFFVHHVLLRPFRRAESELKFHRIKKSMNSLTPEERAIGKENFQATIGSELHGAVIMGTVAAGVVSGTGLGAMYSNTRRSTSRCASRF